MSKTATLTLSLRVAGDGLNEAYDATITNASTVGAVSVVSYLAGSHSVSIPTGSVGCIIVPPTNSAVTKTLGGIVGDTGVTISPNSPTYISFATPLALSSFELTTSGDETITFYFV